MWSTILFYELGSLLYILVKKTSLLNKFQQLMIIDSPYIIDLNDKNDEIHICLPVHRHQASF